MEKKYWKGLTIGAICVCLLAEIVAGATGMANQNPLLRYDDTGIMVDEETSVPQDVTDAEGEPLVVNGVVYLPIGDISAAGGLSVGSEKPEKVHITCWGDSLTASGGWVRTLGKLSGAVVHNGGTVGENARTIMARQGGDVMTVNNITIPAACEPVTIAVRATDWGISTEAGRFAGPLLRRSPHVNPVQIAGILGTLRWTGEDASDMTGTWTFTRLESGDEVQITRPTAIRTKFDRERNGKDEIMIIFMGQNGGYNDVEKLIDMHRKMIDHFKGKEYIILGLSSGTAAERKEYETAMKAAFGRRFISLRAYLAAPIYDEDGVTIRSCYGLEDAGMIPTQEDLASIAIGEVPPSLLHDGLHYKNETQTVIGTMLYQKMVELNILE